MESSVDVSDIMVFFKTSTRSKNDVTNKKREAILKMCENVPTSYLEHREYGKYWTLIKNSWNEKIDELAKKRNIPYTTWKSALKGGRRNNFDIEITYFDDKKESGAIKLEFKFGCKVIDKTPQFLSLYTNFELYSPISYHKFYYDNYLQKYVDTDSGIKNPMPSWEDYLKDIMREKPKTDFLKEIDKRRNTSHTNKKNNIIDESIKEYLRLYGNTIDLKVLEEKVKSTQKDKIYLLWCNDAFYVDGMSDDDMEELTFSNIKNNNTIVLKTKSRAEYHLLLRWKNHKGITGPAWQIALRRPVLH